MTHGRSQISVLCRVIIAVFFLISLVHGDQEFPKGRIIDKVICAQDRSFSYALYLPSSYTTEENWPVIVCFDPRAQGRRPVELLQDPAESYGYVVAGSLESKNGPLEPSQQAAKAVWADIRERFAIDPERVYAAGFSGGAEVAALFPYLVETRVAGIISCGAGLPPKHEPEWIKPAAYCGIIGAFDFRYLDMARLAEPFANAQVTFRMIFFAGWHQWPSADLLAEAVDWLELIAMKRGLKETKASFIEAEYQKRMKMARALEDGGRLLRGLQEYESICSDFKGLHEVTEAEQLVSRIRERTDYPEMEKKRTAALGREAVLQPRALQVFANFDELVSSQAAVRPKDLDRALGVDALLADSNQTKDVFRSETAKRILSQIAILADQRGFRAREAGNFALAVLCFELAVKASAGHPMNPGELYNLAAACALWGKSKDALKNLALAVEKGFDDAKFLENDRDFDSLRETSGFKDLVSRISSKKKSES